jgi:hypothetical protein
MSSSRHQNDVDEHVHVMLLTISLHRPLASTDQFMYILRPD